MIRGLAFVVVRGPALSGKTVVARRIAELLPGKAVCVSQDDIWYRWIVGHDDDLAKEAELVYRQLRLLATGYLRGRYHVVVDASFSGYRDGVAATHNSDLRGLLGLVSTLPNVHPLLVAVTAPLDVLLARAGDSERWDERGVEAVYRAFEAGGLPSPVVLDTAEVSPDQAAAEVLEHLGVPR